MSSSKAFHSIFESFTSSTTKRSPNVRNQLEKVLAFCHKLSSPPSRKSQTSPCRTKHCLPTDTVHPRCDDGPSGTRLLRSSHTIPRSHVAHLLLITVHSIFSPLGNHPASFFHSSHSLYTYNEVRMEKQMQVSDNLLIHTISWHLTSHMFQRKNAVCAFQRDTGKISNSPVCFISSNPTKGRPDSSDIRGCPPWGLPHLDLQKM